MRQIVGWIVLIALVVGTIFSIRYLSDEQGREDKSTSESFFDPNTLVQKGDVKKQMISVEEAPTSLEIRFSGSEFKIQKSSDQNIYIEAENVGKLQAYVRDEKLIVKSLRTGNTDREMKKSCITLYLPDTEFLDGEIELGAGQLTIDRFDVDRMRVTVGAGSMKANTLNAKDLKVVVGAGDAKLQTVNTERMDAEVNSGNLEIESVNCLDIRSKCSFGSLKMHMNEDENFYNYELSCIAGNIKVGSMKAVSGAMNEKQIDNGTNHYFKIDCNMGSVKIEF